MKEPGVFDLSKVGGPEAPTEVAANGAKQSASPFRPTLFPPYAFLGVSEILKNGALKYEAWNWLNIPCDEHLDHMLVHTNLHILKDESEGLLGHLLRVATRANMALHVEIARIIAERKGITAPALLAEVVKSNMKGKIVKTCPHCQETGEYAFDLKLFLCNKCKHTFP